MEAARSAGVAAVARTREVFEAGAIVVGDVIAEFATARFAPELAERTSQQVVDLLFGLRRTEGRAVAVSMLSQPVTAPAEAIAGGRVAVSVWTVSVFVAEGHSPAPEQWSTIQLDMVAEDGRWLVDGWEVTAGPSPAPAPEGVFGTGDEVSAVAGVAVGRGRRGLMIPILPVLGGGAAAIFGAAASGVAGWAWDKVMQGIFTWFAEGLLLLIEFVWGLLDTATTPRLTDDWFVNGVVAALAPIALFVTVAMMLMGAIHGALAGRPELIGDTVLAGVRVSRHGVHVRRVRHVDPLRRRASPTRCGCRPGPNTREVLDAIVEGVLGGAGWGATFLGPLALLIGMIGMIVTTILLFMRSTLLYFVAAFAPLVWSTSVLPMMRGGVRRLVQLAVALVLAKPAIVISLAIGMQLIVGVADGDVAGRQRGRARHAC